MLLKDDSIKGAEVRLVKTDGTAFAVLRPSDNGVSHLLITQSQTGIFKNAYHV